MKKSLLLLIFLAAEPSYGAKWRCLQQLARAAQSVLGLLSPTPNTNRPERIAVMLPVFTDREAFQMGPLRMQDWQLKESQIFIDEKGLLNEQGDYLPSGRYWVLQDSEGWIFAKPITDSNRDLFHHFSFAENQPVPFAGIMEVGDFGKIHTLSNASDSYRSGTLIESLEVIRFFTTQLEHFGFYLEETQIHCHFQVFGMVGTTQPLQQIRKFSYADYKKYPL